MKDLGKEARELLDAAACVDSAPHAVRLRARKRLLSAMAAGSVVTTAAAAKGAWLGTQSGSVAAGMGGTGTIGAGTVGGGAVGTSAVGAGSAVGASTSLAATLVSAMMIGLSTGLVAVSPASQTQAPSKSMTENRGSSRQPVPKVPKNRSVVRPEAAPVESSAPAEVTMSPRTGRGPRPIAPIEQREQPIAEHPLSPQPEEPNAVGVIPDVSETPRTGPAVPLPNTAANTSIARETERLAQVQRALKGGRALMAMFLLDQYREEFPSGKLHEEATASRVVALCALGRTDEARRVKEEFTRRYPTSPLVGRVRGTCEKSSSRPGATPSD